MGLVVGRWGRHNQSETDFARQERQIQELRGETEVGLPCVSVAPSTQQPRGKLVYLRGVRPYS